ncbi:MAG: carbohydrate binding domain-containing protein [Acidobacteriota bacterium]
MNNSIKTFETSNLAGRLAVAVVIMASIAMVWFGVRWQFGNMLSELTPPGDPNANEVAQLAVSLAPRDPLARWLAASNANNIFAAETVESSTVMYEDVVRLSPQDFRWWIELGRSLEQAEASERAETAFRRAVELAPSYTFPRWQIGNFYLRQNRTDEAFAELRKTTEKSIAYREQVFSLAWDFFDHDASRVEALAADSPDVFVTLARFYAQRGSAENALRVWNKVDAATRANNILVAREMAQVLHDKMFYRQSLDFARQTGIDPESNFETVTNGGFEKFPSAPEETLFGWRIFKNEARLDISSDSTVRSEGSRSLKITFRSYQKADLYNISQFVAVTPGARYRLKFILRTENLRSGGPPLIQIVSGNPAVKIGGSVPFPSGSNDWQEVTVDFRVPENEDGVNILTRRVDCGPECPIVGVMWYDNFRLERLGDQ